MSDLSARIAARILGAALSSGAEFLAPAAFAERLRPSADDDATEWAAAAPVHLVVHRVGTELAAALLLGSAERDEGIRATFLFDAGGRSELDVHRQAAVAGVLQGMGHLIGVWVPRESLGDGGPDVSRRLSAALREGGVRRIQAIGTTGGERSEEQALAALCRDLSVPCWIAGDACGLEEAHRPLFHVSDSGSGWTLDRTAPPCRIASIVPGRLATDGLTVMCEVVARGSCLHTLSGDLYG